MFWEAAQEWFFGGRLARCLLDTLFRSYARRRVAELDHQSPGRCQERTLAGLVHQAQSTHFGREHDFRRIRTAADFRRLVPLRGLTDFWRDYWQPAFPQLAGVTWPGPVTTVPAGAPCMPLSPSLWSCHRRAARTAMSFVVAARPQTRLFLGGTLLTHDYAGLAVRQLSVYARPNVKAVTHTETSLSPVSCVIGEAGRLLRLGEQVRRDTGHVRLTDAWPGLSAVVYSRSGSSPERTQLAEAFGDALLLEACVRPEGVLAVEDPRHGQLRLLVDHGAYFEFIPLAEIGRPGAVRHGIGEVEPGVPYAVAMTSPAGVWACLVGVSVCFSQRQPPLLEWVRHGVLDVTQRTHAAQDPPAVQPPHVRGTVPAPAGKSLRISNLPIIDPGWTPTV